MIRRPQVRIGCGENYSATAKKGGEQNMRKMLAILLMSFFVTMASRPQPVPVKRRSAPLLCRISVFFCPVWPSL